MKSDLKSLPIEGLVEEFVANAIAEIRALHREFGSASKCNLRFIDIRAELRARGPDALRALIPLLQYRGNGDFAASEEANVRLRTANELKDFAPELARGTAQAYARFGRGISLYKANCLLEYFEKSTQTHG